MVLTDDNTMHHHFECYVADSNNICIYPVIGNGLTNPLQISKILQFRSINSVRQGKPFKILQEATQNSCKGKELRKNCLAASRVLEQGDRIKFYILQYIKTSKT